jgi:hypothetical protein
MSYKVTITIPSGTVSGDLTGYPVMVRLSDMPAGFWSHVKTDGGDIRIKTTAGVQIPHDLVRFDFYTQDGVIFFKDDIASGSNNSWDIHYGDAGLSALAVDDANGRNAVWADYEAVFLMGESGGDDRTGGAMALIDGDPESFEIIETSSTDLNSHQGVCWDGTYYYTFDTNAIRKWNSSWILVDENTDLIGDAGLSSPVNHCAAGDYHGGKLYLPIQEWPEYDEYNQYIAVFDASDLSFIEKFDISAQIIDASSLCYCDKDGLLYVTHYATTSDVKAGYLYKYDPSDGSYKGTLEMNDFEESTTIIRMIQGITWWRNNFWISMDDFDEVFRVSYMGLVSAGDTLYSGRIGALFGLPTTGNFEGIGKKYEELMVLIDPGDTERVDIYRPIDMDLGAGGGVAFNNSSAQKYTANGRSSVTVFTVGVSASVASKGKNRVPISYWDESAGTTNTRVTLAYRNSTSIGWGVWDPNNLWLMSSPLIDPTLDQAYRLHAVYNGTTYRKMYVNGVEVAQNSITAAPAALDTVLIGQEDASAAEYFDGLVGFAYLYPGVLSADWIAAEYDNLNAPGDFYSVGAEAYIPPDDPSEVYAICFIVT